jgi:hypothetical protein
VFELLHNPQEDESMPSISDQHAELLLGALATENPYAEHVRSFYHEALALHEHGKDLEQFLRTLKFRGSWSPREINLDEGTVRFVCAGKPDEKGNTDYSVRLGFSATELDDEGHLFRAYNAVKKRLPLSSTEAEYRSYLTREKLGGYLGKWGWYTLKKEGVEVAGCDLDARFNEKGQDREQLNSIAMSMVDFSIGIDDAQLAAYFSGRLTQNSSRVELYFKTIPQRNSAEIKIAGLLKNLKEELETDPVQLCEFLVREIAEQGSEPDVDVEKNARSVLILAEEKDLFSRDPQYTYLYERGGYTISEYTEIRYRLAKALLWTGQNELADEVISSIDVEGYDELRHMELKESLSLERYLAQAARGELSRKERKQLRKEARHFFRTNVINEFARGANATLALTLERDRRKYRSDVKPAKARVWEVIEKMPKRFFSEYVRPEESELYEDLFPAGSATLSWELTKRIRLLTAAGKNEEADRVLQELIEDKKETSIAKLSGSVAVAAAFEERPESRIDLEARVAADIELLASEIASDDTVYEGVVERIAARQIADQRISRLLNKINRLTDEEIRLTYRRELARLGATPEEQNGSVLISAISRFRILNAASE